MTKLHFGTAVAPAPIKQKSLAIAMLALAGLYIVMAAAQLGSFEKYYTALLGYQLADSTGTTAIALIIAALEIATLPLLLRIAVSPLMRSLSLASVVLVPLIWALLGMVALGSGSHPANAAYLGGFLPRALSVTGVVAWVVVTVIAAVIAYKLCLPPKAKR